MDGLAHLPGSAIDSLVDGKQRPAAVSEARVPASVAVVAAMADELSPLLDRMHSVRRRPHHAGRLHHGILGRSRLAVLATGEGRDRAARGTASLLDAFPAELLLGIGTAGGLSPALRPGALVVASRVVDGPGDGPRPTGEWVTRALQLQPPPGGTVVGGTVMTSERILGSVAGKSSACASLGSPAAAVVDLESAAFLAEARQRQIPVLIVRAVCDCADEELPIDFDACRRTDGTISRFAVARRALSSPHTMRELWRLRGRVRLGSDRLASFVVELLKEADRGQG